MMARSTTSTTSPWLLPLLLLGILPATVGCEETVDPIVGSDYPFTVWGFLNTGADTQRVRVFPISEAFIPDDDIDARVFSTDLETGERREWAYEPVFFDTLITGHVFRAPFRAAHGRRYRLEVVRSDGATSEVDVTTPSSVTFDVDTEHHNTLVPVRIEGNVPQLVGLRVTYHATNIPPRNVWPPGTTIPEIVYHPVTLSYDDVVNRVGDAWEVTINMGADYDSVRANYVANCLITEEGGSAPDIWLRRMEVSVVAADSSWTPPGGRFDPDVLSEPGTFSNVENGYGFFGAGQGIRHVWSPPIEARLNAGFNFTPRCPNTPMGPSPECTDPPTPCLQAGSGASIWDLWLN